MSWTELEYIESSGTQYIDTRYVANANSSFWMDALVFSTGQPQYAAAFGSYNSGTRQLIFQPIADYYKHLVLSWGTLQTPILEDVTGQRILVNYANGVAHIETPEGAAIGDYSTTVGSRFPSYNVWVFGLGGLSTNHTCAMRLFGFRIYNGSYLVREFIPAKDAQGTVCLYDNVTQTFFYNAGSGVFTPGPEVSPTPTPDFDKKMFLAGVAVGRQLKGWATVHVSTMSASGSDNLTE